jgi:hypothetical protein
MEAFPIKASCADVLFNPDSAVKSKMPEARWNPGAAKASDWESFKIILRLWHVVAMWLKPPLEAPLIDIYLEAEAHRLRCVRIAPRAFCRSQLRNPVQAQN